MLEEKLHADLIDRDILEVHGLNEPQKIKFKRQWQLLNSPFLAMKP